MNNFLDVFQEQDYFNYVKGKIGYDNNKYTSIDEFLVENGYALAECGIVGEFGEIIDLFKKDKFHNRDVSRDQYLDEFGDLLFYVALYFQIQNTKQIIDFSVKTRFIITRQDCFSIYESVFHLNGVLHRALNSKDSFDIFNRFSNFLINIVEFLQQYTGAFQNDYQIDFHDFLREAIVKNKNKLDARYTRGRADFNNKESV